MSEEIKNLISVKLSNIINSETAKTMLLESYYFKDYMKRNKFNKKNLSFIVINYALKESSKDEKTLNIKCYVMYDAKDNVHKRLNIEKNIDITISPEDKELFNKL